MAIIIRGRDCRVRWKEFWRLLLSQFDLSADEFASWIKRLIIHGLIRRDLSKRADDIFPLSAGYSPVDAFWILTKHERRVTGGPNRNKVVWYRYPAWSRKPNPPSSCAVNLDLPIVVGLGPDKFRSVATEVVEVARQIHNLGTGDGTP